MFANCLSVVSPIPLVAPTKTATSLGGSVDEIRELDDWIADRETISAKNEIMSVRRIFYFQYF